MLKKRWSSTLKSLFVFSLTPLTWLCRKMGPRLVKLWSFARLSEAMRGSLDISNIVLGPVELHGTRNIYIGCNALIYPGVYLETQGAGIIEIGNNVVLSTGVHIVAFERITIEDNCMVGEYSSIRDANHRASSISMRSSGYDSAPINIAANVWIGRGVTILKGIKIGCNSIIGANAVVTKSLEAQSLAVGVPARVRETAHLNKT